MLQFPGKHRLCVNIAKPAAQNLGRQQRTASLRRVVEPWPWDESSQTRRALLDHGRPRRDVLPLYSRSSAVTAFCVFLAENRC